LVQQRSDVDPPSIAHLNIGSFQPDQNIRKPLDVRSSTGSTNGLEELPAAELSLHAKVLRSRQMQAMRPHVQVRLVQSKTREENLHPIDCRNRFPIERSSPTSPNGTE
jgi:hypothetical protein